MCYTVDLPACIALHPNTVPLNSKFLVPPLREEKKAFIMILFLSYNNTCANVLLL